ncbi:MAG: glycosyltransferase family 9 protein [PVC group bacterium]
MIKKDCRYYLGDRPCRFHKAQGVKCKDCSHYSPFSDKILVIKLDAVGDVLRTTSILPGLKKQFPESHLTWITGEASLPVFINNPFVDRVLPLQPDGLICARAEKFRLSINLDTAPMSASLHALVRAGEKKGFTLDRDGRVSACGPSAEEWLRMSVFDDAKKANHRTCQAIMREILELPPPDGEIVLNLLPEELLRARRFAEEKGLGKQGPVIGFNTGAGRRWKCKKWTEEGTLSLARLCVDRLGATLLLYGGPEEEERNRRLLEMGEGIFIDTGCRNDLRTFFALLSLPDLVVTSDTLALHAAGGLKKKVVALFGPTSAAEIDLYGRGEKVVSPVPCRCCYRPDCDVVPDCMESITPEMVFEAIRKLL